MDTPSHSSSPRLLHPPLERPSTFHCNSPNSGRNERVQVRLNVYDLNPADAKRKVVSKTNDWGLLVGLGAFHSGVEVYGVEYSFGSTADCDLAVQPTTPRQCSPKQYTFRQSIDIGTTNKSFDQVENIIRDMAFSAQYQGFSYNILGNNCNDFSDDLCRRLTGKPIPTWVNRGARALDNILTGASRVRNHPMTKSVGNAITVAGQRLHTGVQIAQVRVRRMYASLDTKNWIQCIAGKSMLASCYGRPGDTKGDSDDEASQCSHQRKLSHRQGARRGSGCREGTDSRGRGVRPKPIGRSTSFRTNLNKEAGARDLGSDPSRSEHAIVSNTNLSLTALNLTSL